MGADDRGGPCVDDSSSPAHVPEARPWLTRSDGRIGVVPCGSDVRWLQDQGGQPYVQRLRQAEGRDCDVVGDVLLSRDSGGATALLVEEPYWSERSAVLAARELRRRLGVETAQRSNPVAEQG